MQRELEIIERLEKEQQIDLQGLEILITTQDEAAVGELAKRARETAQSIYGNKVYIRGLIEFTNYCKNDCLYCGIRRSNGNAERYRLSEEQILSCCATGYELGFRTFVLQGGEDAYFTDERICTLVAQIKKEYPIARLRSLSEKNRVKAIRHILTRGQTVICCAMRLQMRHITENCIRQRCH